MKRPLLALIALAVLVAAFAFVRSRSGPDGAATDEARGAPATRFARAAAAAGVVSEERIARDDDPAGELRLEGQVIDLDERPVEGAIVVIDANPRREARTEADGAFAFDGLVSRTYRVEARSGGAVAGPVGVSLRDSSEPVVLRLLPAARVLVQVVDAGGDQPIAGALVELRDLAITTATTDGQGRAELDGVSAGAHVIKVSATGYAAAYAELTSNGAPGATSEKRLRLYQGARVSGTVIDPAGRPVEDARVVAESATAYFALFDPRLDGALTDAKGRFEFDALSRSTWRFLVSHPRHAPASSELVVLSEPRDDVVIRVALGGELRGRVVDDRGAPVAAAEVRVTGPSRQSGETRYLRSGADGRFSLGGLPRSQVYVVATSEGATSPLVEVDLGRPGANEATIPLRFSAGIEGVVVTSSGAPVPEARVVAVAGLTSEASEQVENRLRGIRSDVSDADGRFRLAPLEEGRYRVRAIRADSPTELLWMKAGTTVESGARDLRLVVDDLTSLHGRVRFADGAVPRTFVLSVGAGPARPFTGDDGRFQLDDVPSGAQSMVVGGPELVRQFEDKIVLAPGVDNDLGMITVHRGRSVRGRVVDGSGAPVPGATVVVGSEIRADGWSLVPYDSRAWKQAVTGADGRFTVAGLAATEQVICAEHEQRGRAAAVEVAAGKADAELTLTLQTFSTLQGNLRSDGRPAAGGIFMRPDSAASASFAVDTGLDGTYRFDRLAPGKYLVWAMREDGTGTGDGGGTYLPVTLAPGQAATLDIDLASGSIALTVVLRSPGDVVEYGYVSAVRLPPGVVLPRTMPTNLREGRKALNAMGNGELINGFVVANRRVRFDKVKPGHYVVCVIPMAGSPEDPAAMAAMSDPFGQKMFCAETTVAESPPAQDVAVTAQPAT